MTDEQKRTADAYARVFGDGPDTMVVFDDLTAAATSMSEANQSGATRLLLYMLTKRSAARRAKTRGPVKPATLTREKLRNG